MCKMQQFGRIALFGGDRPRWQTGRADDSLMASVRGAVGAGEVDETMLSAYVFSFLFVGQIDSLSLEW